MRRSAWVAVVAAVGLGLTGCSDPGTPSDTLPTAASTSAEPTLPPLGPADFPVPAEAREQTNDGALAMASYYLDLIDFSRPTLDASVFIGLSDNCETCEQLASGYASDKQAGNSQAGGDLSITDVGPIVLDGTTADLTLQMAQAPVTVTGPNGQTLDEFSTGQLRLSGGMVLQWDVDRVAWIVNQLNAERY